MSSSDLSCSIELINNITATHDSILLAKRRRLNTTGDYDDFLYLPFQPHDISADSEIEDSPRASTPCSLDGIDLPDWTEDSALCVRDSTVESWPYPHYSRPQSVNRLLSDSRDASSFEWDVCKRSSATYIILDDTADSNLTLPRIS